MNYVFVPIAFRDAQKFVKDNHRHNKAPAGSKFCLGLKQGDKLIGVGIASRPVSRNLDNGTTLEIIRVCVLQGYPNACSKIYARMKRIGQLFGYNKIITYTLKSESQSSLKAFKANPVAEIKSDSWATRSREKSKGWTKHQKVFDEDKIRWEL